MPLKASPSRPTSSLPATGTWTSSRRDRSTSVAALVSRTSGPVTVVAISQPSAAAAAVTRTTSRIVRVRRSSRTLSFSASERPTWTMHRAAVRGE